MLQRHLAAALVTLAGPGACRPAGPEDDTATPGPGEVVVGPEKGYRDSLYTATFLPDGEPEQVACAWAADGTVLSDGAASADAGGWTCAFDALGKDLSPGTELSVEVRATFPRAGTRAASAALVIAPQPLLLVSELDEGTLAWFDPDAETVVHRTDLTHPDAITEASVSRGYPTKVDYSPDRSRLLVVSSSYGTIQEVDPATGERGAEHDVSSQILWYSTSPDGRRIHVSDWDNRGVAVFDLATWERLAFVPTGIDPFMLETDRDGRTWVPNRGSSTLTRIAADLATADEVPTGEYPYHALPAPDGASIWVPAEYTGHVYVHDAATLAEQEDFRTGFMPVVQAFSPDGTRFYTCNFAGEWITWGDVETREILGQIETDEGSIAIAFRDDGRIAWVANLQGGTLSVLDLLVPEKIRDVEGFYGPRHIVVSDEGALARRP